MQNLREVYRDRGLWRVLVSVADLAGGGYRVLFYHLPEDQIPLVQRGLWRECRRMTHVK
jgi:hypothetical protein